MFPVYLTEWRYEGSVMLVRVAARVIWWLVGLKWSTLGVVVRGGWRGVMWRGFAASSSVDTAIVSMLVAWLESEVVLGCVWIILMLRGRLGRPAVLTVNISWS